MKVYCVGFTHKEGVSRKTGKAYNCYILHCLKKTMNSCGYATEDFFVDVENINDDLYDIIADGSIGCVFNVDRNNRGFIDSIEFISREPDLALITW